MLRVANSDKIVDRAQAAAHYFDLRGQLPQRLELRCVALCAGVGTNRGDLKKQGLWLVIYVAIYAVVYCFAIDVVYGLLQMGVVLSLPVLRCYNGRAGAIPRVNRVMKWLFYLYYPLHLLLIGLLSN